MTPQERKVMELALDFVEDVYLGEWRGPTERQEEAITAIKEALAQPEQDIPVMRKTSNSKHHELSKAQPEQKPVAYGMWDTMIGCGGRMMYVRLDKGQDGCTVPLYTTPPQRTWVGLTEQEAAECWSTSTVRTWQAIEAKLKEKNT